MKKGLGIFSIFNKEEINLIEFMAYSIGLVLGILTLVGIILGELKLFNDDVYIRALFIIFLLIFASFFFINLKHFVTNKKENVKFIILFGLSLIIPLITILISRFPATDFWAYHAKNLFLWHFLLPAKQTFINWVPFWHLGYPLLQMYAPGTHVLVIISTLLTRLPVIFNDIFINIISYIFTIFGFYVFVSRFTNRKIAFFSSMLLIFFGRFVNEVFVQGHHTNFLSLGFGFLGLSIIGLKDRNKFDHLLFVFFMFLSLIFHHGLFSLLGFSFVVSLLFIDFWKAIKVGFGLLIAVLLSGFWLLPVLVEQVYWTDAITGFNPLMFYLLSYGPFILLALTGFVLLLKKYTIISYFISVLALMSIIPILIISFLPIELAIIFNKIFTARFKATLLVSILLLVFLSYGFFVIIKSIKLKRMGYLLLILWFVFSGFLINIYIRQDGVRLITKEGVIIRDSADKLYFDNYERLKEHLEDNDYRYSINPDIGPLLFGVSGVRGSMGPRPRRDYIIDPKQYDDYLSFIGTKTFVTEKNLDEDKFEFLFSLGNFTEKSYGFDFSILKHPIRYFLKPEDFPTNVETHEFKVYKAKEVRKIIEVPEFKPIIYSGRLNEAELVSKEYYKIPIIEENIETGIKVDSSLDIKPIEFENDVKVDYEISIEKITINLEKSSKKIPLYIKINYSPHWKAYDENGNELKIYKTFSDLMLVETQDTSIVEMFWEKTVYDFIGLIISIFGIILLIILLI